MTFISKYRAYSVFSFKIIMYASRSPSGIDFCEECKEQSYTYSKVQKPFEVHFYWFGMLFYYVLNSLIKVFDIPNK